jgi:predicted flap endonuclease-1-like 5' DNA nuclease
MATAISPEARHQMIAEAAWRRFEARGFVHGFHEPDWIDAEQEVSAKLGGSSTHGFKTQVKGQDNLEIIEGIGPKIAELLIQAGIPTFAALAAAPVDKVQAILTKAGPNFLLAKPDTWGQQAALAARGAWAELRRWQDELTGGVAR